MSKIDVDPNYKLWMEAIKPGSWISINDDPRLHFFFHLGFAISRWAYVDRGLFDIFRVLLGSNSEATAAYLFYKSPSIAGHFQLTDNLIKLSSSAEQEKAWSEIAEVFNDQQTLNFRNRLAHDPITVFVSGVGTSGSPKHPPATAPLPEWQMYIEGGKLLQPKKLKNSEPITVEMIIDHIEKVTKLKTAVDDFLGHLPKRL